MYSSSRCSEACKSKSEIIGMHPKVAHHMDFRSVWRASVMCVAIGVTFLIATLRPFCRELPQPLHIPCRED